jgi:heptosyltransferase-1
MAVQIASLIGHSAVVLDRYPLKRFAALLKQVDLVVGADTGPVHLAAAVDTPTVSFYRSSDGSESGPRGSRHVIVQSPLPCTRCFKTSCPQDLECRSSIKADDLFAAACRLLDRNYPC